MPDFIDISLLSLAAWTLLGAGAWMLLACTRRDRTRVRAVGRLYRLCRRQSLQPFAPGSDAFRRSNPFMSTLTLRGRAP